MVRKLEIFFGSEFTKHLQSKVGLILHLLNWYSVTMVLPI